MRRRTFMRAAAVGLGSTALGFSVTRESFAYPAVPGPSPYGELNPADGNGILLPNGFTSRVLGRAGEDVAGYVWHDAPDGGACYPDGDGWIYVSNSEVDGGDGGASAMAFDAKGNVTRAYRILGETSMNCSGGATPWGTWLSCEEVEDGFVHESDPKGVNPPVVREAMGKFKHEAAAADPDNKVVYQTEDIEDGCFYRFVPTTWGDLAAGVLQVLCDEGGALAWKDVPDPAAADTPTRDQVPGARRFSGGEGCYYNAGTCLFTAKGEDRVWAYDATANTLVPAYENTEGPLGGVDQLTGTAFGDIYVAEDGDNMEICIITPDDKVAPFLRVEGQSASELTGVAFNPAGDRMYFSSQRGDGFTGSSGITYEVTGPFRR